MTFEMTGESSLDYLPCRYGKSRLLFRGPKRDLDQPYLAFLGGTETYGKFIAHPFAAQIEDMLGIACVNFGCANAGVDVFLNDPFMPEAARAAGVTVIQITGALNLSNRMYAVHPRRNDRFVGPSQTLQNLFEDVDFAEFNFTKHLLTHLRDHCEERFGIVREELERAWVSGMVSLLARLPGEKILLWIADHAPDAPDHQIRQNDPMLVNRAMIDEVSAHARHVVEVVASAQARAGGTKGMVYSDLEYPMAAGMMSPLVHQEVAEKLAPVLRDLI